VSKVKTYKNCILQIIDFKKHVFDWSRGARIEAAVLKIKERENGARTPNRVFYRVNYAKGSRAAEEDFTLPVT
jgi:hypothetical protein